MRNTEIELKFKFPLFKQKTCIDFKFFSSQANQWKGKISADISFPLYGLEMGSYVASRAKISPKLVRKYNTSKKHLYAHPPEPVDCIYDLFAVCNHIGPYITSGHYTAICKNSANGNWYCFDDSEVSGVILSFSFIEMICMKEHVNSNT